MLFGRAKDLNLLRGVVVGNRDNTMEGSHLSFADNMLIFFPTRFKELIAFEMCFILVPSCVRASNKS